MVMALWVGGSAVMEACSCCGECSGWCLKNSQVTHGCDLWKSIHMGWDGFLQYTPFDVGEGSRVWFWHELHDRQCGNQPLRMSFPDLYDCLLV